MSDGVNEEWREACRLVKDALDFSGDDNRRALAFNFLRTASSEKLVGLAHLLQPGATERSIQAALVPLERADRRTKVTDVEMGIRSSDIYARDDKAPFVVIADNIRSAFNTGGIFRSADFFGAERIILCGYTPSPENVHVKKTALGSDESVKWETARDVRDVIDSLRSQGYKIYALETAEGAEDISTFEPEWPCAVILGNERFGIDPDVCALADKILEIPSHGMKNSLNVVCAFSVAAAFLRKWR